MMLNALCKAQKYTSVLFLHVNTRKVGLMKLKVEWCSPESKTGRREGKLSQ